jgi:hypothetical protein
MRNSINRDFGVEQAKTNVIRRECYPSLPDFVKPCFGGSSLALGLREEFRKLTISELIAKAVIV